MLTVDIDTGGTMTDAFVTDGTARHCIKVDTTPHDYTVSFQACLEEAARRFGFVDTAAFLREVSLIRWSSTITTNVLAERRGAKVGLLVSEGHAVDLYGDERSAAIDELVSAGNVIGLSADAEPREILLAVKSLLEHGVRRVCISLKGAFPDNRAEIAVKDVIEAQYPDHIIGSVPVLLGSEMVQIGHDQTRAHYSLMNAYTHTALATSLFKAEDLLREAYGWTGPLLVGNTSGGVARIGKTKAVDTIESGPVFGTFGGAYLAREYGLKNVVCFDVGGTTTKCSIVRDGQPVFQRGGELMEVPVKTLFAMLRSAAIGGGSVARIEDGHLRLGPESMGASPGPACYALGGSEATLTDALLTLGYLDPGNFLGGRRQLDLEAAKAAIERSVAKSLSVAVEQAALLIRDEAVRVMAELIENILAEAGLDARDTALFAFGGNGPMFGVLVADRLGIDTTYAFDFGPVLAAFGSSVSDVVHVYERGVGKLWNEGNRAPLIDVARRLHNQAVRDLQGEGFPPADASYRYEIEFGELDRVDGSVRVDYDKAPDDAGFDAAAKAIATDSGVDIAKTPVLLIRLVCRFEVGAQPLQKVEAGATAGKPAERVMRFNGKAAESLPAHVWERMAVGQRLDGPAMVNGATLTVPVPPGWSLEVDAYRNAVLRRQA